MMSQRRCPTCGRLLVKFRPSERYECLCGWKETQEQFPEAPFAGYYFDRKDARQFGFRSHNGFDVSAVCKRYGGGGHAAAAGFTSAIGWLPDPA